MRVLDDRARKLITISARFRAVNWKIGKSGRRQAVASAW
jgi:hypothetical protein